VLYFGYFYYVLQGAEEDAGRIGLTVVLAGMMGSLIGGIILDRMHLFK
jgi:FLVCR family feline leukemia virus subgroup C receptor-related protein